MIRQQQMQVLGQTSGEENKIESIVEDPNKDKVKFEAETNGVLELLNNKVTEKDKNVVAEEEN